MKKWQKILIGIPVGIYLSYVFAIVIFLNTPIFREVTEMSDDAKTHIELVGAWSLFPGTIHAAIIKVLIREPDVELDVLLHRTRIDIDLQDLLRKQARMPFLHVGETSVAIRKKTAPREARENRPVEVIVREALLQEQERLARRWTISIERVEMPNLSSVKLGGGTLRGKMAIRGSFMLQPGTQAEIYPSSFTIEEGAWNDEITGIQFKSTVQIHRFMKASVSGSEVLRYLQGHLEGNAKANDLRFVNVTLHSLGDYGFGKGDANLSGHFDIRGGKILDGSALRAERSEIQLEGPRFDVAGKGELDWRANGATNSSTLHAEVHDANTTIRFGGNQIRGSVHRIEADAKILGLDLTNAFTGLSAHLRVEDGRIEGHPIGKIPADRVAYRMKARIGGELSAIAGDYPDFAGLPASSHFAVDLDESNAVIPKLGTIDGAGRVAFKIRPIDFRRGRADLPELNVHYRGQIDGKYPVVLGWTSTHAGRVFGSKNSADDRWEGNGILKLSEFNGLLKYLSDTDRISGLMKTGLHATVVKTVVDWKIAPLETRLNVHDIDSNGIWSAFGTIVSTKPSEDAPAEFSGDFKAKVLGLPIEIGLAGKEVKVKMLSGGKTAADTHRP